MPDIVRALSMTGARGIVTSDYQTTAWLRFYLPSATPVIQIEDEYRFAYAPQPTASDFTGTLIYVGRSDIAVAHLKQIFLEVENLQKMLWPDDSRPPLTVYRVSGFKAAPSGRMP